MGEDLDVQLCQFLPCGLGGVRPGVILKQDRPLSIDSCRPKCLQLLMHQVQIAAIGHCRDRLTRLQKVVTAPPNGQEDLLRVKVCFWEGCWRCMFVDSYISTLPVVVHNIRDSEKTSKSKSEGSSPEDVLSEDLKYGTESGNIIIWNSKEAN